VGSVLDAPAIQTLQPPSRKQTKMDVCEALLDDAGINTTWIPVEELDCLDWLSNIDWAQGDGFDFNQPSL
jgi:hypothetical protein